MSNFSRWIPGSPRTVTGKTDDVVIVGAGLAGLSAAMRLAGAGRKVTVIERESIPGGRAGRISDRGFEFDTGPTVLTMPDLIADAFDCLGENMNDWLTLEPVAPLYRAFYQDGSVLDVHSDTTAMAAEIEKVIGASEADGYLKYVDFVTDLYKYEMKNFIDRNIDSPLDLLSMDLVRLIKLGGFRKLAPKVGQYLKDDRTQRVFSFQSMYAGLSPYDALAIYAVIAYMDSVAGVFAPKGGMHALPVAMAKAAAKHGVTFKYDTEVTKVRMNGNRATGVETSTGEFFAADVVVLNPDLPVAYRDLLGKEPWSVKRLKYSPSCYLLLAGSSAKYDHIAHHNIHFGHSWAGVFEELIDKKQLMSDPSVLVTNPTYSDPGLAPDGKQVYYVLFLLQTLMLTLTGTSKHLRIATMQLKLCRPAATPDLAMPLKLSTLQLHKTGQIVAWNVAHHLPQLTHSYKLDHSVREICSVKMLCLLDQELSLVLECQWS